MARKQRKKVEHRCVGCGKVLESGEQVASVSTGVLETKKNGEHAVLGPHWGFLHRTCFLRSVRSPELILEEIGDEHP